MGNRKIPSTVLLGSILLLVIILLVIAAPLFTSYAPDEAIAERLQEFSFSHPLERIAMGVIFSAERCMAAGLPSLRAFLPL